MVTRKKKETGNTPSGGWPNVVQGTHLTVKTFEDGHTELVWDWDALVEEVRLACASIQPEGKLKRTRKAKEE